jgi:hyperosmotically inducible periplasmic protein
MKTSNESRNLLKKTRLFSIFLILAVILIGYSVSAHSAEDAAVNDAGATSDPAAPASSGAPESPDLNANGAMTEVGPVTAGDTESYEPDNTGVNERDRDGDSLTAEDQSQASGDIDITQNVRKAVMADDSLSFTAKNVKIITVDGAVTLRGPVKNEQEKSTIDQLARSVDGIASVDNQLEASGEEV